MVRAEAASDRQSIRSVHRNVVFSGPNGTPPAVAGTATHTVAMRREGHEEGTLPQATAESRARTETAPAHDRVDVVQRCG
ncbi:Uncharacterized protein ToN1_42490 [Aromatoleum petrolei]|nr:Uncharacterized protein ToN1_42490 [Aromatoleum petrolei]